MNIKDVTQDIEKEMKDGVKRLLSLDVEIKGLQEDKKRIKKDLKENGVDMKLVNKIISLLKRKEKESNDPIIAEAEKYLDEFLNDSDIDGALQNLFERN